MGDTVSSLLFQPPPPTKLKEEKIIWVTTKNGIRIPAFYICYRCIGGHDISRSLTLPELEKSNPAVGVTLLYSHANAEDLGSIYPWCKYLSKMLRVNIFAYDYTGYGMAYEQGPPAEEHCNADIEAVYSFLRNDLHVAASNIVLYGRSLGSGPSCHLAAGLSQDQEEEPVGGVILHAPFMSVFRIVLDTGCTIAGDKFPNIDLAPLIASPVLIVHGTADQIVPFYHAEKLHAALQPKSKAKPLYIEGMSHNNVHSKVRPLFIERLQDYLEEHVQPYIDDSRNAYSSIPVKMALPEQTQI
mmetsp:Transcript_18274/g.27613  ORF Transcript_18274/g.27613 Transcript_18274/m.27613 type:complete len:299 (-) Transcript_18274:151-1047(-)|eukprot:CAMPEP_0178894926 /NCGR_PEP_ID=MMETSP0786-20121207/287_1 /TAXON_ID=186022 /ORGANISM="Thalassionema frauenfeldii, Strain CCMP 1798" /LENGTH=298 /DNA_ID=CAMNT_0020565069 /DNA_START=107 /DNA_END=1003 /DNA_ORIENTATION=-